MSENQRTPRAADLGAPGLSGEGWVELLETGSIEVLGRMPDSSNATFLVCLRRPGVLGGAIYKPEQGERPLWDFPGGLYRREVAAFELAEALDLRFIPETIVREEAPYGVGSLQRFIAADPDDHYFNLHDGGEHESPLRLLAGLDLLLNNADRKGGHILLDPEDHIWGIDNGLSFHVDPKLRTVMWDFAGEEVPPKILDACRALREEVPDSVVSLLEDDEVEAMRERAASLLEWPHYPVPLHRRAYPWPLV